MISARPGPGADLISSTRSSSQGDYARPANACQATRRLWNEGARKPVPKKDTHALTLDSVWWGAALYHIAAFSFLGVTASALITQAERFPPLMFGLILLFVVFETFVVLLVALIGAWIMQEVAWWAILVGNVLAATSMGAYLRRQHPALKETLREEVLWAEP